MDAVYGWSRFDSLPRAFAWVRRELEGDEGFAAEFVRATTQFGNQGTIRRIGTLIEREQISERLLARLERQLRTSSTFIPWIPNRQKRGTVSKRWRVVVNDD
jgi:predicted transcriptional regulator of viral defense system